CMQHKVLPWTF
nr:immunoglobulin light chain junction region [Macaca mulatta]MOV61102.1 immunoglobulin light chain junction region [Macaca mulatta]MOV61113.1 immunoglobulin light chain junction region [Macaca mulatta]MOV61156.1 immunoglobulin light chain junction region [Macaca mulatta]MOV61289.1 immunoglobulin light chain junction region [Macaca mulatta]